MSSKEPVTGGNDSPEYKQAYRLSHINRANANVLRGRILTLVESSLGETKQSQALKSLVTQEIWRITDETQRAVYDTLTGSGENYIPVAMSDGEYT